jgi:hypothetical protein
MRETFKDLGVCDQLIEACDNLGWKNPSKIQAEAIPHALDGPCYYFLNLLLCHCGFNLNCFVLFCFFFFFSVLYI